MVAIRCQAVDVARNISTVWRTVATGERWLRASGGYGRAVDDSYVAIRCQAVDVARNISTVWRAVATGERWLRESGG